MYMGVIDPGTAYLISQGFQAALHFAGNMFSQIGAGRKEADVISPVANSLVNPQRTGRLDEIVREYPQAGITQLQNLYNELQYIRASYLEFLHDPSFVDGRASAQAEADMIPLIDDNLDKIANRIYSLGGRITQPPQVTQNTGTWQPRLNTPAQTTFPAPPQPGVIWPNAPLPTLRPQPVERVETAGTDILPMLLIGGVALTLLGRR
jgi:hypothetical protein